MLYGHVLSNLLPLLIRILFQWQDFQPSKKAITFYCLTLALSQFLYQYLKKTGTPKRDPTGNLVSPGDDLNHPGMTEWIFDILYISCEFEYKHNVATHTSLSVGFAQVGSAILGEWFWWIYLAVLFPLFFWR
jgi:SRP-independent targeting protein 2/TMEM208